MTKKTKLHFLVGVLLAFCIAAAIAIVYWTGPMAPDVRNVLLSNAYGMEFVTVPAGRFMMGCSPGDRDCEGDERPRHEVTISRSFQLGVCEVTQGQWAKVMGNNPSHFRGDDNLPVEQVSWNDAQTFVTKLSALNDGYRYRLPTEAEWEYAARGRTTERYYGDLDEVAWYDFNSCNETHPVGQKQPNRLGLYDMLGNVSEWCSDLYGDYNGSSSADPRGPSSGEKRVLRGGSWFFETGAERVSCRFAVFPNGKGHAVGLRVCREKH